MVESVPEKFKPPAETTEKDDTAEILKKLDVQEPLALGFIVRLPARILGKIGLE